MRCGAGASRQIQPLVGKTISLDGAPHVVVGVMPADFHFFANHDLHALASLEPRTDVFRPIAIRGEDIGWQGDYNNLCNHYQVRRIAN